MKRMMCILAALALTVCAPPAAAGSLDARARLDELGYLRAGAEDMDVAVRNFQTANALEVTGGLDEATLAALADADALSKQDYLRAVAERYPAEPLKSGDTGGDVRAMQEALRELGYYGGTRDGVFGDATRVAVMAFQTANGLAPTGEADRAMLLLLHEGQTLPWEDFIAGKVCKRGDSGVGVRSLQRRLKRMGYYNGECTDAFGESTQRAVERFQEQNGLEATGAADEETCRLLYSGAGVSLADDGVLRQGDAGEDVAALQGLLHALGYLPAENSGAFGADTFVAVTLFQIANGLAPTGEADEELLNALRGESATPLSQAEEALRKSEAAMDAAALSRAAAVAAEMPGQAFDGGANANYPGFPFAQYVYARVGVGLTGPGRILEEAVHQPFDAAGATGGEIVILQNPDGSLLYAVSLGGARVAYADAATGFVVSGDLSSMNQVNAYVWKPSPL